MHSVKINIAANFAGKIWSAAITLLLVPIYIKYLGIESYGLIGFYTTLVSSFAILDFGLSTALTRELARLRVASVSSHDVRSLVLTLECIYWLVGLLLAGAIILLAPEIGAHWLKSEAIPKEVVIQSIVVMGMVIAFQWPISIYSGGLSGLEQQVLLNSILVVMSTIKAAGVLLLFLWRQPTIQLFFTWQAITTFLHVVVIRIVLWRSLPKSDRRAIFSLHQIKTIKGFAAGMTGIGIITFFLTQIDKVILSRLLPLEYYGYYMLAFNVASVIGIIVAPINSAIFPRLSVSASLKNNQQINEIYHSACKLVSVVIFPVGLLIVFFPYDIILVWTKNSATAQQSAAIVQIMTIGSLLNALMIIPTVLLWAHGNTRYIILQNTIASFFSIPLLFWWVNKFGATGAAFVWLSLNLGYIMFSAPIILRRYLSNTTRSWYIDDIVMPLLPSLVCVVIIKLLLTYYFSNVRLSFFLLGLIEIIIMASVSIFYEPTRQFLLLRFRNIHARLR